MKLTKKNIKSFLLDNEICVNNKYLTKYVNLIIKNISNIKQYGYDKHHIIPRYYYKHIKQKIDNSETNLIFLSRSDHILAHIYLCFCSFSDYYKYANSIAVLLLTNIKVSKNRFSNKTISYDMEQFILEHKEEINETNEIFSKLQSERYKGKPRLLSEDGRKRVSESSKQLRNTLNKIGIRYNNQYIFVPKEEIDKYLELGAIIGRGPHTEESNKKNRLSHIGKSLPHTEEWNKKIALGNTGKSKSEELKRKISMTLKGDTEKCGKNRGKIIINNGIIYKYVYKEDFDNLYQFQGWTLGKGGLYNPNTKTKGKIRINNENGAKYVTLEEFEEKYSKEGWHRGYDWKK